jgi:hypothetical protein
MSQQVAANPTVLSEASAGRTYENRDIRYVVFNSPNSNARNIWLDCGIHAREWVSPATCVYIIDAVNNIFLNDDNFYYFF